MPNIVDSLSFEQQLDLLAELADDYGVQFTYKDREWGIHLGDEVQILYDDRTHEIIKDDTWGETQEETVGTVLTILQKGAGCAVFRVFAPDSWEMNGPIQVARFDGQTFTPVSQDSRLWTMPKDMRPL